MNHLLDDLEFLIQQLITNTPNVRLVSPPRPTKQAFDQPKRWPVVRWFPVGSDASRSGMRCTGFEANWPSYRPDQHFRSWAACPHGGALGRTAVGDHIRFELYAAKRGERSAVSRFGKSAT